MREKLIYRDADDVELRPRIGGDEILDLDLIQVHPRSKIRVIRVPLSSFSLWEPKRRDEPRHAERIMIDGPAVVAALEAAGFTHLVWIPDSHLGTWDEALSESRLPPIRVCREGEAVGLAAGLMLGGAKPLVAIQCTGFFEAGDAVRNVVHDLKLPLKLLVGVRSWRATREGRSQDNAARFAGPLVGAWGLPYREIDPFESNPTQLAAAMQALADDPGPAVLLWGE